MPLTNVPKMPRGSVMMWSGALADIPYGFHLCDGTVGTVDLIALFVVGVPDAVTDPGATGGAATHVHTNAASHVHSVPVHSHTNSGNASVVTSKGGTNSNRANQHTHPINNSTAYNSGANTYTVDPASSEPPYYEVAFIQRMF